jgi:hypothetical protein
MAKQQDSSRVSSTDMSLTTKIQKARKVLESVQEVNLLPICNIVNVSKEIQEKFCNEFKKHKPSIQQTKKFFDKEKVKLENECKKLEGECKKLAEKNKGSSKEYLDKVTKVMATHIEIKAICKVLDIATLLEKFNLNIIDILKTAGISSDIYDKFDSDCTINQALQYLEELTTGNSDPNTASSTKTKVLTESTHDKLVSELKTKIKKFDTQESSQESGYSGSSSDELSSNSTSSNKSLLANTSPISNKIPPCPPPRDYSKHYDNDHHDTYYHSILGEHYDVLF